MAMTVTATQSGQVSNGTTLQVKVLTGAIEAGGASVSASNLSTSPPDAAITPNATNSLICFAIVNTTGANAWTLAANNTAWDNNVDSTSGYSGLAGFYSGAVTSGTPVTAGASGPTAQNTGYGIYEVKPSSGSTPAVDASSPAGVNSTGTTAQTASFNPPGGSVLVVMVAANGLGGAGSTDFTITDTSGLGLTWVFRAGVPRATTNGDVAIFTATVPAAAAGGPLPWQFSPNAGSRPGVPDRTPWIPFEPFPEQLEQPPSGQNPPPPPPPGGSQPGGLIVNRRQFRAFFGGVTAPFIRQLARLPVAPGLVISQRRGVPKRAILGGPPVSVIITSASTPPTLISLGGVILGRRFASAVWGGVTGPVPVTAVNGTVPRLIAVYQRARTQRSLGVAGSSAQASHAAGGVRGTSVPVVPAPKEQLQISRRFPPRAVFRGLAVAPQQPSLLPRPPPTAVAARPLSRRSRGFWHGNAVPGILPVPNTDGLVKRRSGSRAVVQFTPVKTVNATASTPAGSIQPAATFPLPRRTSARAVAGGVAGLLCGAWSLAQQVTGSAAAANNTPQITINTSSGSLLVALFKRSGGQGTGAMTSVTDSAGNPWVHATTGAVTGVANTRIEAWYTANALPVTSVQGNSATSQDYAWNIQEWSGVSSVTVDAVSANNSGLAAGVTPIDTPSITTTGRDLIIAAIGSGSTASPTQLNIAWTLLTDFNEPGGGIGRAAYYAGRLNQGAATGSYHAEWTETATPGTGTLTISFIGRVCPVTSVPVTGGLIWRRRITAGAVWRGIAVQGILPVPNTDGLVRRRTSARAFWAGTVVRTVNATSQFGPPGNQPGSGLVKRRTSARAFIQFKSVKTTNALPVPGNNPGGAIINRRQFRVVWGGVTGPQPVSATPTPPPFLQMLVIVNRRPFWAVWGGVTGPPPTSGTPGNQPGSGLVKRRTFSRAFIQFKPVRTTNAHPAGNQPGGIVKRRISARAVWGGNPVPGRRQIPVTGGLVKRRTAARGFWRGIAVPGRIGIPVTGGLVKRRTAARATWLGTVVRTVNTVPQFGPPGNQPGSGLVKRRTAARAVVQFTPVETVNAIAPPIATTGGLVKRRTASPAVWHGTVVRTTNIVLVSGKVPPRPVVARRTSARAVWAGNAEPGRRSVPVTGGLLRRRTVARAVVAGYATPSRRSVPVTGGLVKRRTVTRGQNLHTIVRTVNALPVAGSQPGGVIVRRNRRQISGAFIKFKPVILNISMTPFETLVVSLGAPVARWSTSNTPPKRWQFGSPRSSA